MIIGVAKERIQGEKRVALIPESVKKLKAKGFSVIVEKDAGLASSYTDDEFKTAGAEIEPDFASLSSRADILLKVRHPVSYNGKNEAEYLKEKAVIVCMQDPIKQKENLSIFETRKLIALSLEFIPRSTLAQSMDVLSSMATLAGYKAVLIAASEYGKIFPMLMTAAGTLTPAKVLIIGAGVAGLQAIATARRLGAVVEAFDVRTAAKEQVESLGGKFIEMEITENLQDAQGYAKEASAETLRKQMELLAKHLRKNDICITTAQVFGKKAPILITTDMVSGMRAGSVIVDIAVEQGGNCELSQMGKTIEHNGVRIMGPVNLPSQVASHASQMFSRNVESYISYVFKNKNTDLALQDEIVKRTLLTIDGKTVSELLA